jgi:hypothetical protein
MNLLDPTGTPLLPEVAVVSQISSLSPMPAHPPEACSRAAKLAQTGNLPHDLINFKI